MEKVSRDQIELLAELQERELEASKIESVLKKLPAKIEEMSLGLKEFESAIEAQKEVLSNYKKMNVCRVFTPVFRIPFL